MHVLSVSSLKGGVGKTTVALGLASAAFARGLRTLVVDLDPQSDASTGLGAIGAHRTTVAEVLKSPKHSIVLESIVSTTWAKARAGVCDLMVGSPASMRFDEPQPTLREVWKLDHALQTVERKYDLVIIDTPPSLNALSRTAWLASDGVVVVADPSIYSVVAAERAARAIAELAKALSSKLRLLGVVVNRYRPESSEHVFRAEELAGIFGENLLPQRLLDRTAMQQATGATRQIHAWPGDAASELAAQFDELLDELLDRAKDVAKIEKTSRKRWFRK